MSTLRIALAQFLNERALVGLVGYGYYQLTGDSGSGATLVSNKVRLYAVGPQAGYFFPFGAGKGYVKDATAVGAYHKGMATFTVAKGGLMYEASIGGQKFKYTPH